MSIVHWLTWSTDAFARARADDKPVLLSIAASWCETCRLMDDTTYADPAVVALVNESFVPIRVDADRRPDIGERYSLGGWPTTAFLTADGAILGGGTYVPLERMAAVLVRVVDAFRSRQGEISAGSSAAATASRATPESANADLAAVVFSTFDEEHGGFGGQPKFPLTAPLDLALASFRQFDDRRMAHVVEATLDAMGWGQLYDEIDGGFFRCAMTRDWQQPRREKLLDVNAQLLRVYVDAAAALNAARYRERAEGILRYVQTWLADPVDGGWGGSQQGDSAYYERSPEARAGATAPPVDHVLYASCNAAMVSSALHAAEVFDDVALGEFALRSLERVVVACYRPGAGVAHYVDGEPRVRGLLDDQISMAAANLDAHAATGNIVYEMMAQELAHYAIRTMWDDEEGGFFDRADAEAHERIGLMRNRLKPFIGNCDAARVLRRLAATGGDHDFGRRADETLAAMAPLAWSQGPLAAHYLLATMGS